MYISKALDIQSVLLLSTGTGTVKQKSTYLRQQNPHTHLLTGMEIKRIFIMADTIKP
jgi:hypothetical protein